MIFSILKILFIILGFQFVFVSSILFASGKGNKLGNSILAVVFLLLFVATFSLYFSVFHLHTNLFILSFIDDVFMFLYGPLLYFFTQSVVFRDYKISWGDVVHLVPALIFTVLFFGLIFTLETDKLFNVDGQMPQIQAPIYVRVVEFIMFIHIFCYLYQSKRIIDKALRQAQQIRSHINYENIKTLKFILISFAVLFTISFLHAALLHLGIELGLALTISLMVLVMLFFILSILIKMLTNATNMSGLMTKSDYYSNEKYARLRLTAIQLEAYKKKLNKHFFTKKSYLDSNLNVDELASELSISPKILSQVINEGFGSNFYDFINKHRIEFAKERFKNPIDEKMTIQEVMFDSGFNSKSSFNTAFKKYTGLTPTAFKNKIK